ncbi:MAG: 30S ribosomal protein S14 [Gammaproteobacteria bacterium]|nr:30S ribosomal protein S14 [Gammaproteobacteria bacterium]
MAKRSVIERNKKRINLVKKFESKRRELKEAIRKAEGEEKMLLQMKLANFPINSAPNRVRNRCELTGRPRGVYRKFGLARNMIRIYAMLGQIPGVVKSSW